MSEKQSELPNRQTPFSEAFRAFIGTGWEPDPATLPEPLPATAAASARRDKLSAAFPGERIVIPAGGLVVRSNDTDYRFRPHSAFAHLIGLGTDKEPDAVLVLEPTDSGHDAALYFKPRAPRESDEFYANARYGEMWVGKRETLDEMAALSALRCVPIEELEDALRKNADQTTIRLLRAADRAIAELVEQIRSEHDQDLEQAVEADKELEVFLSELRLIKDDFEIEQMRDACARTAEAFAEVVKQFPEAVRRGRGERWVEGVFGLHARHVGNAVGYDSIVAAGNHANTLHWIRNDGDVRDGDLILIDAGIELDSLYTADVTRTLPINGTFTDAQRKVYEAVLAAQQAGLAAAKAANTFSEVHKAAIAVIAEYLQNWGILPVSAEESLSDEGGHHRRWMVHGTSHHLGIDVHDCAQARRENYRDGTLQPGMVITVEPGIYFKADDLLVPEELRGIGVRIEDDVLITETGNENLSAALPRSADEVEAWMAKLLRE
jgi:Xaa-Pro aminopeptidase